jgi:hypothetical protein
MKRAWATLLLCLGAISLIAPRAVAQDRGNSAWKECHRRASSAMGVSMSDVRVKPGGDSENRGNYILNWEARRDHGRRTSGYCEVDRRDGRVVRFETNPYDRNGGGDYNPPSYGGDYPRARVDTDGRGYFSSRYLKSDQLDRGYVDTNDQPSVTLRGRDGFRITFFGRIVGSDGRREITLQITATDRGDARGRASIRLNDDRNEVEAISLNGSMDGGEFRGEFNRNR